MRRLIARRRRAGYALALVMVVLTLMALLATATGGFGILNLQQVRQTECLRSLELAADGGLHELMDRIYSHEGYDADGSGSFQSSAGRSMYRWSFDPEGSLPYSTNNLRGTGPVPGWGGRPVPAGTAQLLVTATAAGDATQPVTVGSIAVNSWPYAIAADGTVQVEDVLSEGDFREAHVRSNMQGGSPNIAGGLVQGQTFSRDGEGSIQVEGEGQRHWGEPDYPLPDLPLAEIVASYSAAGVEGLHPYGGPAPYQFEGDLTATTDDQGALILEGTRIPPGHCVYLRGNLTILGASPTLAAGLHLFVDGDLTVNGALRQVGVPESNWERRTTYPLGSANGYMVSTGVLRMNGGSALSLHLLAERGLVQNGSSTWRGFLYVRQGALVMNGRHAVQGVIVARSGLSRGDVAAGGVTLTHDPDVLRELLGLNLSLLGPVRTRSWWME